MGVNPVITEGEEPSLSETGIPVRVVLHVLATSGTEEETVRQLSSRNWPGAHRVISIEDVRAAAAYSAAVARDHVLPPPTAAAYEEWWMQRGEQITAELARGWAFKVLPAITKGLSWEEIVRREKDLPVNAIRAALEYGSVLAGTRGVARREDDPDECFLRNRLSPPDRRLVEEFFDYRAGVDGLAIKRPTLEESFHLWVRLVERVEQGYDRPIQELTNSLDHRDTLEDALSLPSPVGQEALRELVRPWNERFDAATAWVSGSLMGPRARWKPRRWWWFRVPKQAGPQLAADLSQAGIACSGP
jgi:uncharacterized protein (DUF433 family)